MITTAVFKVPGGKYFIPILAVLVLQGCLSYAPQERFAALSAKVTKQIPASPVSGIKTDRREDRLTGVENLNLKTAIRIAIDNNPDLRSVSERVKEAMGKYPLVTALDDPTIGVGLFPSTLSDNQRDLAYKVDFGQPIPYPGKLRLRGEEALASANAMFDDYGTAKLELIRLVKTAYFELVFAHSAIEINETDKKLLQEFKTITSARYATGEGNLQENVQVDLALAKVEHKQIVLNKVLRVAVARLNILLGRRPELYIPAPSAFPDLPPIPDRDLIIEKALSGNRAIKAAKFRIESAEAGLKLAELQAYPDFTLAGSYNRAWMDENVRPFVGVSMNVPIQFGRLRAEKNIGLAKFNRAKSILKAMEDNVRFGVEEALQTIEESRHAERLFRKTIIPESELNLSSALAGYSSGKNDFLTLITAQRELVDMRLKYKRIMVDVQIWEAKLVEITGEEL